MADEKKPLKKYQLTIRLYEDDTQSEVVTRTVNARDADDAIANAGLIEGTVHVVHTDEDEKKAKTKSIVADLLFERLNPKLKAKVIACRQVGEPEEGCTPA